MLKSKKLICHSELLMVPSQLNLISKFAKFHYHYAHSSDVMGKSFLTLVLQIKFDIRDNPNKIALRFSPKNQLLQVRQKQIFSISLKTHKAYRKRLKSFVEFYSYNYCTIHQFILCLFYQSTY